MYYLLFFFCQPLGTTNFGVVMGTQFGMYTVSAGKAAFIVGLNVVVTPFLEAILPNSPHPALSTWVSVFLCLLGTYFLSGCDLNNFSIGEVYLLGSTLSISFSILATDAGAKRVDCIDLTIAEFVVTLSLCIPVAIIWESDMWDYPFTSIIAGWKLIVFVGVAEAVTYLLETLGQMFTTATRATLIMSLDAMMTCIIGYLFLGEILTMQELFGCFLLFMGTLISVYSTAENEGVVEDGKLSDILPVIKVPDLSGGVLSFLHVGKDAAGKPSISLELDRSQTTSAHGLMSMSSSHSMSSGNMPTLETDARSIRI